MQRRVKRDDSFWFHGVAMASHGCVVPVPVLGLHLPPRSPNVLCATSSMSVLLRANDKLSVAKILANMCQSAAVGAGLWITVRRPHATARGTCNRGLRQHVNCGMGFT